MDREGATHETGQVSGTNSYADSSAFVRLLEHSSRVHMLDVFLGKHYTWLTVAEIAELAAIDKSTVYRNIDELLNGRIIISRTVDGKQQFKLNPDNQVSDSLKKVHSQLLGSPVDFSQPDVVGPDSDSPAIEMADSAESELDDTARQIAKELNSRVSEPLT